MIIAYRWHPLHGQRLPVVRRKGRNGTKVIDVRIGQGASRELPAWMADEAACAATSLGPPQISVAALIDLRAVLSLDTHVILAVFMGERTSGGYSVAIENINDVDGKRIVQVVGNNPPRD